MDGALRAFFVIIVSINILFPAFVNGTGTERDENESSNNHSQYISTARTILEPTENKNSSSISDSFEHFTKFQDVNISNTISTATTASPIVVSIVSTKDEVLVAKSNEKILNTESSTQSLSTASISNVSIASTVITNNISTPLPNVSYVRPSDGSDTIEIIDSRADISPHDFTEPETTSLKSTVSVESSTSHPNYSVITPSSSRKVIYPSMSWLDVFMLRHRDSVWVIVNTIFMVIWILIGLFSLYRLFGLPWCSPYISRTKYLVIHLLIFTASTFEFVQLIHLSYGSHEGLPLFLTLLLTHTPTPCLAAALILTFYCVLAAARVPVFSSYMPPIIYVSILMSFIIVLSFVGDIIVGVTRISLVLILIRATLLVIFLFCALIFLFNYRKVIGVALLMRREYRGDLKALAIPIDPVKENTDSKLHLKKIILVWTRVTLVSCLLGILMCAFSFSLSLFFTIPYVPLWAFWVVHTSIFVSQILVVFFITFGATFTLTYNNKSNIFRKYFCPSFSSVSSPNGSFIKRGNFIYQRVSVANGPVVTPASYPPTIIEAEECNLQPSTLVTELSAPPCRSKVNLKRSATFNCAPPYGFHQSSGGSPFTPNLYPVLSDHILPYSQPLSYPITNSANVNYQQYNRGYEKPTIQYSHSFHHYPSRRENEQVKYSYGTPFQSFQSHRFAALDSIAKGTQKDLRPSSVNMAGTVEALEVPYPSKNIPVRTTEENVARHIPQNHSFNAADRQRSRPVRSPPEKPARKTGPILVKSIMKDNACIESAVPLGETSVKDNTRAYSPKDYNNYLTSSNYQNNFSKYAIPNISLSPTVNTYSDVSSSTPLMISKNSFNTVTPSVSPISSQYHTEIFPSRLKTSPIDSSSVLASGSPKLNGTSSSDRNAPVTEINKLEEVIQKPNPVLEQNKNDHVDLSISTDETRVSIESTPPIRRQSLRRNHSTAGDFSQHQKQTVTDDKVSEGGSQDDGEFKHPWYGTWGGRRKSKKRHSALGEEHSASNSTLRRLSASKSSLSSIYEKLKPKKNKGTYRKAQTEEHENNHTHSSSEANENFKDEITNSSISHDEEEEEELLPRLDEDIDLASEILKTSTVLADFYSLDRSYLKKRKKERMEGYKEEEEDEINGTYELNGMKNELESNGNKLSTNTLHAEEST
ncbi:UNVERIFIED_CONTAM: hypothetical protein RMT77_007223 [Armadillidium vulgare]